MLPIASECMQTCLVLERHKHSLTALFGSLAEAGRPKGLLNLGTWLGMLRALRLFRCFRWLPMVYATRSASACRST